MKCKIFSVGLLIYWTISCASCFANEYADRLALLKYDITGYKSRVSDVVSDKLMYSAMAEIAGSTNSFLLDIEHYSELWGKLIEKQEASSTVNVDSALAAYLQKVKDEESISRHFGDLAQISLLELTTRHDVDWIQVRYLQKYYLLYEEIRNFALSPSGSYDSHLAQYNDFIIREHSMMKSLLWLLCPLD